MEAMHAEGDADVQAEVMVAASHEMSKAPTLHVARRRARLRAVVAISDRHALLLHLLREVLNIPRASGPDKGHLADAGKDSAELRAQSHHKDSRPGSRKRNGRDPGQSVVSGVTAGTARTIGKLIGKPTAHPIANSSVLGQIAQSARRRGKSAPPRHAVANAIVPNAMIAAVKRL